MARDGTLSGIKENRAKVSKAGQPIIKNSRENLHPETDYNVNPALEERTVSRFKIKGNFGSKKSVLEEK